MKKRILKSLLIATIIFSVILGFTLVYAKASINKFGLAWISFYAIILAVVMLYLEAIYQIKETNKWITKRLNEKIKIAEDLENRKNKPKYSGAGTMSANVEAQIQFRDPTPMFSGQPNREAQNRKKDEGCIPFTVTDEKGKIVNASDNRTTAEQIEDNIKFQNVVSSFDIPYSC